MRRVTEIIIGEEEVIFGFLDEPRITPPGGLIVTTGQVTISLADPTFGEEISELIGTISDIGLQIISSSHGRSVPLEDYNPHRGDEEDKGLGD